MNLYNKEMITTIKEKVKEQKIIISIMIILTISIDIFLFIIANINNQYFIKAVTIIITTFSIWYTILSYSLVIKNSKYQIEHINKMLNGRKEYYTGTITNILKSKVRFIDLNFKGIVLNVNDEEHLFYLNEEVDNSLYKVNDIVTLHIVNEYICYMEVHEDEK